MPATPCPPPSSSRSARTIWSISPTVSRGDLLDRRERLAHAVRTALGLQPPHTGVDEDHVDRVPGRVVQVARDPAALLRGSELTLALGVALGAPRALLQLGDPLAPQARPVARDPGTAPDEDAVEDLPVG